MRFLLLVSLLLMVLPLLTVWSTLFHKRTLWCQQHVAYLQNRRGVCVFPYFINHTVWFHYHVFAKEFQHQLWLQLRVTKVYESWTVWEIFLSVFELKRVYVCFLRKQLVKIWKVSKFYIIYFLWGCDCCADIIFIDWWIGTCKNW